MHWFDTREGKMIVGDAAYESIIEQSGPGDIVQLAELLDSPAQLDVSDYDRPVFKRKFTKEEIKTYGQWILTIIDQLPEPPPLKHRHIENAARLGLTPGRRPFMHHLGTSIWDISEELGAERSFYPVGTYDDWSVDQFIDNARQMMQSLTTSEGIPKKPSDMDYIRWAQQGNGPSPEIILRRTGMTT